MHTKIKKYSRYLILTLLVLGIIPFAQRSWLGYRMHRLDSFAGDSLKCILSLRDYDTPDNGLLTGFNYELLKRFASEGGFHMTVTTDEKGMNPLDSLRADKADMVVMSVWDTIGTEGALKSRPIGDCTVWVMRDSVSNHKKMRELNHWISGFSRTDEFILMKRRFFNSVNPWKDKAIGESGKVLSPYDGVIRDCADSLGWDWRMLSAVIWQESQFHIQAKSRRGAMGLMQMMPRTAGNYGHENPLDPEESIRSGARYLGRLQRMFRKYASDKDDLIRYTLAAYNAGEGRLLDCLRYASSKGVEKPTWEELSQLMPRMSQDSLAQADTNIRFKTFKGNETVAYVDSVFSIYDKYKTITGRGRSVQDLPLTRTDTVSAEAAL